MKLGAGVILLFVLFAPWVINFIKFTECDFEENYKCELIHGIGVVVPPLSYITVWFGTDE